jgi:hypothetical protein
MIFFDLLRSESSCRASVANEKNDCKSLLCSYRAFSVYLGRLSFSWPAKSLFLVMLNRTSATVLARGVPGLGKTPICHAATRMYQKPSRYKAMPSW